jgi:uncharacterized metal-binding protein
MSMRVRPLPVLYACQGCDRYGQAAREPAERLERRGRAAAAWIGAPGLAPKARFPLIALDACEEACARQWLQQRGARVDGHYVLSLPGTARRLADDFA